MERYYRITRIKTDELYHHGIKGQKWGERRFQNPDGTLTEKGKRRYARQLRKDLEKVEDEYVNAKNKHSMFKKLAEDKTSDRVAGVFDGLKGEFEEFNGKSAAEVAKIFEDRAKEAETKTWKMIGEAAENGISVTIDHKSVKQLKNEARGLAFVTNAGSLMASLAITLGSGGRLFVPIIPIATTNAFMPRYDLENGRNEYTVRRAKRGQKGTVSHVVKL